MKDKKKLLLRIIICAIILIILSLGVIYATSIISSKGELNDDNVIDYRDVNLLEMHLINLKTLPEEKLENADMNNDGEITVTDLALLIQKIENKREYDVKLINIDTQNYYPEKNEQIEITFEAEINYEDVFIEKIVINGQQYDVKIETGVYKVELDVGTQAGKKEYNMSKVILNTGAEVKIDNNFEVSVLKEYPYIEESSYKLEETFEGKAYINFNLVDAEQSITSAQFRVYEIASISSHQKKKHN